MSKLLNLAMLGLFLGATMVGCRASAEVEGDDDRRSGKKTVTRTEIQPDGDKKVTKETKTY